jgi:hypothetical protein
MERANATVARFFCCAIFPIKAWWQGSLLGSSIGIPAKLGEKAAYWCRLSDRIGPGGWYCFTGFFSAQKLPPAILGPDFCWLWLLWWGLCALVENADWGCRCICPWVPFSGELPPWQTILSPVAYASTGWLAEVDSLPGWLSVVASSAAQKPQFRDGNRWIPAFGQLGDGDPWPAAILIWGSGNWPPGVDPESGFGGV